MKQTKIFWGFLLLIIALVTGCSKEDVGNNDSADQDPGLYYQINNGAKTLWNAERFISALTDDNSTVLISTVGGTKMNSTNYKDLLDAINSTLRSGLTLDFSGAMAEEDAMVRSDDANCDGIKEVSGFPVGITSLRYVFRNFSNLTSIAEIPNSVTNMYWTFYNCKSFNQPITIPESVTNMCGTFYNCTSFNQPITVPNRVTDMNYTFYDCTSFNQPITIGNSVTDMGGTFNECKVFNQPITIGNSVTDMGGTFAYCYSFNQPITIPESVTDMRYAFRYCSALASTITIYGADSLDRGWIFEYAIPENIDLILGPKRASEWTEGDNTWQGYTFKSITSTSAE